MPPWPNVLRENLFLTGTKIGCGKGECGACSVIMNGKVVRSCITRIKNVPDHAAITTIEGVGTPQNLHALQLAWIAHNGAQCGFCTPGFIVSAKALLDENQKPTRGGGKGLVSEAPQRVPVHGIQAPRRRGHGRGPRGSRRAEGGGPCLQDTGRRKDLGHEAPPADRAWPG